MTVNPRQSFKLKLCLCVLGTSLLVFLLICFAAMYFTTKEVKSNVNTIITSKQDLAWRALTDRLTSVEITADNFVNLINSPYINFTTETANDIWESFLAANRHIHGVRIGYEDASEFSHPGPWCPYAMRHGNEYVPLDVFKLYDFRESEWYATPVEGRRPGWSKPFRDPEGAVICSYSIPVFDKETGDLLSVFSVDQSLNELSDSLQLLRPYEGSNIYAVDQDGRYIAHPDTTHVLSDYASAELMESVRTGEQYYLDKSEGGQVFYFPVTLEKTGWTVLISVPRKAFLEHPSKMMKSILLDMILGIILLLGSSLWVISRLTRPLENFAEAARQISHGNFNVDLPVIKDHNELYDLRTALASMGVSLDNYVLQLEKTNEQKVAIEKELDIARNIQMAMVPKIFPPYPDRDNLDIFASLTPAQAVGGDLYDFVLLDNKFFFCIGDVSGKGVPASLFMAITRTLFRNTVAVDKKPSEIAETINRTLADGNDYGMFVTMIIGSFDMVTGELQICNCGHNLPVTNGFISDPSTMKAEPASEYHLINGLPANIAVGVIPDYDYEEITMYCAPGCMLLLYTDGVTEAENKAQDLYDETRMLSFVNSMGPDCNSLSLVDGLRADVMKFAGDADQSDDITMLCLRCNRLGC